MTETALLVGLLLSAAAAMATVKGALATRAEARRLRRRMNLERREAASEAPAWEQAFWREYRI